MITRLEIYNCIAFDLFFIYEQGIICYSNTGQRDKAKVYLDQERYQISCGIAVVINNTEFESYLNLPGRVGSDVNAASLSKGFQKLGFKSKRLNNVSREDLEQKFNESKTLKSLNMLCVDRNFTRYFGNMVRRSVFFFNNV